MIENLLKKHFIVLKVPDRLIVEFPFIKSNSPQLLIKFFWYFRSRGAEQISSLGSLKSEMKKN